MKIGKYYETKYEGYFISKDGEIVSFRVPASKSAPDKRVNYNKEPRKMSYKKDKDGYFEVLFSVNCKRYYKKVHQVVAETFLGDKPTGNYVVDHKNRNRQDNRVENLRWLPLELNSDGQKGHKTASCKRCVYKGVEYGSLSDALKAIGMTKAYFYNHPELKTTTLIEGVETIEIREVSRVGRKWLPIEVRTTNN